MSTTTLAKWFPVKVETTGQAWPKAVVVLAQGGDRDGLWVFTRPDEAAPAVHVAVVWAELGPLPTPSQLRQGFTVPTDAGPVTVTRRGCSCGSLGTWSGPSWANKVARKAK